VRQEEIRIEPGTVYWLTGLAGAGKTTLARQLVAWLRRKDRQTVLLDGDELREVFVTDGYGYSPRERLALAGSYGRLCGLLAGQGVDVVCATISMFHQVRRWNREHISRYCEVYVKVPLEVLVARDKKGLYGKALAGEIGDVVGVNGPFEEPENPDILLENDGARPMDMVRDELLAKIDTWRSA